MNSTQKLKEGIESVPGLTVIGNPVMSVFSFCSDRHDIYRVGEASSNVLISVVKTLSRILPERWFRKLSRKFTSMMNGKEGGGTTGAAYGMTVAIENRDNVDEIMLDVLDGIYSV